MSYRRLAGIAGILAVILIVVPQIPFLGGYPAPASSGQKILAYLADNHRGWQVASLLWALGVFFYLLFLAGLWSVVRESDDKSTPGWSAALAIGGTGFAVLGLASGAVQLGLLESAFGGIASAELASALWITAGSISGAAAVFLTVFAFSIAAAGLKIRALPAAIGWLGLITGILAGVAVGGLVSARALFAYFGGFAQLALSITVLVAAIWMVRERAST